MMEFLTQSLTAKVLPVVASIEQMEMPDVVDMFGRGHRMPCVEAENYEALVFEKDAARIGPCPTLFATEPSQKGQTCARLAYFKGENLRDYFLFHKVKVRARGQRIKN